MYSDVTPPVMCVSTDNMLHHRPVYQLVMDNMTNSLIAVNIIYLTMRQLLLFTVGSDKFITFGFRLYILQSRFHNKLFGPDGYSK